MSRNEHEAEAFPRLDESQIALLEEHAERSERRHFADGEQLLGAGGRSGGFFVVLTGAIEIVDMSSGEPRRVALHEPGEFTGDVDIVSRRRSVVSMFARGETEVLQLASSDVRRIIGEHPSIGDILLRAFIARRELLMEQGFVGLRIIGHGASRAAFLLREFISRNHVPFTWIDVDDDEPVAGLIERLGIRDDELPVVMHGERAILRNPSTRQLAELLGLRVPLGGRTADLVVVGAGPAGLAAAVYASSEGLDTVVLDAIATGGQAGASMKIENYLGFPTGITGAELMGSATLQAQKFGARISTPSSVTGLDLSGEHPVVHLEGDESIVARAVLIATGADYRRLAVPERERFDGVGVYYAATKNELAACGGSEVIVVGGGNSAGQAVMFLADHTSHVHVLLRGDDLYRGMSSYLAKRIQERSNVEVHFRTEIRHLFGASTLEAVEIEETRSGERRRIETPAVFTFIGAVPRTEWLRGTIATNDRGFIVTGREAQGPSWPLERSPYLLETSHPGVFAAGDVRLGSVKRVSSAVGEGSMVVKFVHEWLAERSDDAQLPLPLAEQVGADHRGDGVADRDGSEDAARTDAERV